jgi:hypothetical protein
MHRWEQHCNHFYSWGLRVHLTGGGQVDAEEMVEGGAPATPPGAPPHSHHTEEETVEMQAEGYGGRWWREARDLVLEVGELRR